MSDLNDVFPRFCAIGHIDMDGRGFLTLCRSAGFMDECFTETDAESIFNAATLRSKRRMSATHLGLALACVAERKHVEESVLRKTTVDMFKHSKDRDGMKHLRSQSASSLRRTQRRQQRLDMRCCAESAADLLTATATSQVRSRRSMERPRQQHARSLMDPASLPALKDAKLWGRKLTAVKVLAVDALETSREYDDQDVPASDSRVHSLDTVFTTLSCGQAGIQERSFVSLCQRSCLFDSEFTAMNARRLFRAHCTGFMMIDQFVKALEAVAQARNLEDGLVFNMVLWSETCTAAQSEEPAHADEALHQAGDHSLDSSFVGPAGMLKLRKARHSQFGNTKVELVPAAHTVDECCSPETPLTVSTAAFSSFSGTPSSPSEFDALSSSRSTCVPDEAKDTYSTASRCYNYYRN